MTFLDLEWYWWLLIVVVAIIAVPFKIKFMKWGSMRQQEKKNKQQGRGGGRTNDRSQKSDVFLWKG